MESRDGLYLVVAEAACRYTSPARFEDDILIRTALAKSTDRVIRYQYEIRRKCGNELLATGATAHVVTGRNHQASRLPGLYREYFSLPPRKTAAWE
jgi:acyl-CoA thioester hydrolase